MAKKRQQLAVRLAITSMLFVSLVFAGRLLADEPYVSTDGWRPKRQPASNSQEANARLGWPLEQPILVEQPALVSSRVADRWCSCQHSSICGHCGLQRPIRAAYLDAAPFETAPFETTPLPQQTDTFLVNGKQWRPAVNRLRLAMEQVNEKLQQTLGQF